MTKEKKLKRGCGKPINIIIGGKRVHCGDNFWLCKSCEKKLKRCEHCGQELEYYEGNQKYCVACFDLWNKGKQQTKKELDELQEAYNIALIEINRLRKKLGYDKK